MQLHRVAGRFFSRPLLLAPGAAETISAFLLSRLSGPAAAGGLAGVEHDAGESREVFPSTPRGDGTAEFHAPRASRFYGEFPMSEDGSRRPLPFRRTAEGVANITLVGEWVNRGGYIGASSGLISYEGFKVQMLAAAADPRTKAILLDLESPGGEAVGAFEAAEVVRQVAKTKPVTAVVNGMAASAAYAIASAANRIVSIPTGISGSIGVVLMHLDISEYLKAEGLKPTFIFAGDHKVDGNPYEPLPEGVRADLQREVEGFYAKFVETVAKGRAGLDEKAIRATKARCFMGEEAVAAGLVDAIGTFEEVLADLSAAPGGLLSSTRTSGATMNTSASLVPGAAATFTQADLDAARATGVAEGKASRDQEVADAKAAGATEERGRIQGIIGCDEAKGREASAHHLAFTPGMTVDTAKGVLAGLSKSSGLDNRMSGRTELNLDPDDPASGQAGTKQEGAVDWAEIAAAANARLPANARVPSR